MLATRTWQSKTNNYIKCWSGVSHSLCTYYTRLSCVGFESCVGYGYRYFTLHIKSQVLAYVVVATHVIALLNCTYYVTITILERKFWNEKIIHNCILTGHTINNMCNMLTLFTTLLFKCNSIQCECLFGFKERVSINLTSFVTKCTLCDTYK